MVFSQFMKFIRAGLINRSLSNCNMSFYLSIPYTLVGKLSFEGLVSMINGALTIRVVLVSPMSEIYRDFNNCSGVKSMLMTAKF